MSSRNSVSFDFDALRPLTLMEALDTDWQEPDFILGPLQPGDVGLIAGADGAGKSWLSDVAGLTVAAGVGIGGIFERPKHRGAVIHFSGEDRREDHGRRLRSLLRSEMTRAGLGADDISHANENYVKYPLQGVRMPLMCKSATGYEVTDVGHMWSQRIASFRLVIVDPMRMVHDLDESDGVGMDSLVRWLVFVAMKNRQGIVLVHQASQQSILTARDDHHAGRGATDFPAGCRSVWILRAANEKDGIDPEEASQWRVLKNSKASHKREFNRVLLRREESGVLVAAPSPTAKCTTGTRKSKWSDRFDGCESGEF